MELFNGKSPNCKLVMTKGKIIDSDKINVRIRNEKYGKLQICYKTNSSINGKWEISN